MEAQDLQLSEDKSYKLITLSNAGLDVSTRPDQIDASQAASLNNVLFSQGEMRSDTGYATYQQAVIGAPRLIKQFKRQAGTTTLCLITDTTFYIKAQSEWQYVSDGTSTTATDGEPAGEVNLVVGSITGFADGDNIGVIMDNGKQHQTTVNGAPTGSTIVMTDAVPVGRSIPVAAAVVKAAAYSGTAGNQVTGLTAPAHDYFIFTNGVDVVQRYDGSTVEALAGLSTINVTACKTLAILANHLILFNTTESGSAKPQKARNSDTADFEVWNAGNAGFVDLFDTPGAIVGAKQLGPYVIVYKDDSIIRAEYVGTADILIDYQTAVRGVGALSAHSIAVTENNHVVMGPNSIYQYQGAFSVNPISKALYHKVFGVLGELGAQYRDRVFGFYVKELNEVFFFYPDAQDTYPGKMARIRLDTQAWSLRDFGEALSGFGRFEQDSTKKWSELVGAWTAQTWQWNSVTVQSNAPLTLLCGSADKQVFQYDYLNTTDDGSTIDWSYTTKDFFHPRLKTRIDMFELKAKGSSVLVEYSTDHGNTWVTYVNQTLTSSLVKYQNFTQFVADRVRWRFSGTGSGFALTWFGFQYLIETEW